MKNFKLGLLILICIVTVMVINSRKGLTQKESNSKGTFSKTISVVTAR